MDDIHLIPQTSQNVEAKSVILAPFNTTISNKQWEFIEEVKIEPLSVIKFSDKAREANRQYEFNYNEEVDNGVMISQSDENALNKNTEAELSEKQVSKLSDSPKQAPRQKKMKLDPLESSDSDDE